MYLRTDLRALERHIELLEEELSVCRRILHEAEECCIQKVLVDGILFWKQECEFMDNEMAQIRKRMRTLSQTVDMLRYAEARLEFDISSAKRSVEAIG